MAADQDKQDSVHIEVNTGDSPQPVFEGTFYWGESYIALPRDPQPWLIEKLVPVGSMNVYGKPKVSKSWAALGIACALSDESVHEWLGHKVIKHGPVAYLQIDTPRESWAARVDSLKEAGYDISRILFTDANLVPYPFDITVPGIRDWLKEQLKKHSTPYGPPIALVVDTLREVHDGDEDKSDVMKKVITGLYTATKETNTTLILVSHARKDNPNIGADNLMDDGRGSSYIPGRMDMVAKLTDKKLLLQGRSIGKTAHSILRDKHHMLQLDGSKGESEANIRFVLAQEHLKSDRDRAAMLAAMEDPPIELETARSRIREYKKKREKDGHQIQKPDTSL